MHGFFPTQRALSQTKRLMKQTINVLATIATCLAKTTRSAEPACNFSHWLIAAVINTGTAGAGPGWGWSCSRGENMLKQFGRRRQ
jgi:hypothetical protein